MVLEGGSLQDKVRKLYGFLLGLTPFVLAIMLRLELVADPGQFITWSALLFLPAVFTAFIFELFTGSERPFVNLAFLVLGIVYIGIPFALVIVIAFDGGHFYADTVFGFVVLTWVNDTGAYFVGSSKGRRLVLPRVSPKKTWEGTIGGVITTFVFGIILHLVYDELSFLDWMVLSLIVSTIGTLGDFIESLLKRSRAVKDSGNLLPGHGGFLDRFDTFIFSLPYVAAYLLWLR